jgi:nuclear pore complex protein Nup54
MVGIRYRFRALFYNVVDDPNQRQKPLGVDEVRWRESLAAIGGPNNPERLWPVQASGFSDLEARLNQQEKTIVEDQQFLESIRHLFRERQRQRETTTRERINRMREKHQELQHFLLRIMAKVSALEGLSRQMSGMNIINVVGF